MDDRPPHTRAPQPEAAHQVEVLRIAAETLRDIARQRPRGPWRWGEPDLGVGEVTPIGIGEPTPITVEPTPFPGPHLARSRIHAEPLTAIYPTPARQVGMNAIGPEMVAALATLLDGVAERIADGGATSADEVQRAAVAVARCVIHAAAGTTDA
jgi:hypothetical protein